MSANQQIEAARLGEAGEAAYELGTEVAGNLVVAAELAARRAD
jgi:hypothetical protein